MGFWHIRLPVLNINTVVQTWVIRTFVYLCLRVIYAWTQAHGFAIRCVYTRVIYQNTGSRVLAHSSTCITYKSKGY